MEATVKRFSSLFLPVLFLVAGAAVAQQWPAKPVRIIVPFPPGQAADIVARVVAERLTPALGQQVIVDNRPGAGSMVGSELAAKAPPDGYTFLAGGTSALAINVNLYAKPGYDTLRDFAPITNMNEVAMVFCVNPALPARNVSELIALAKQRPNQIDYGSSGNGSTSHLAQALFAVMAGINIRHIPYKGSIPNLTDVIAGQIMLTAETTPTVLPHVKTGRLRAVGVAANTRIPFMPDVATVEEQGVRGYDVRAWTGLVAPTGTPVAILDRMNKEVVTIIATPEVRKRLFDLSLSPVGSSREHFTAYLKSELAKWAHAVKVSGAKVD